MPEEKKLSIEPVPGQASIEPPAEVEAQPAPTVKGYLIEKPMEEGPRAFLHIEGQALSWTSDTQKAMRFTRSEDAKQAQAMFNVLQISHVAVLEFPA